MTDTKHEGPIEALVEDVESLFPSKPGGIVERARMDRAHRQAAEEAARQSAEPVQESNFKSVKVTVLSPEITSTNVVNIPAGGTAMILPNNEYRSRAVIKASAALIIAKDNSQALGQVGYPYAATDPPLVITSRAQLFAYAAGATVVSVIMESYAPNA
jgi:hypothetical protein